MLKADSQENEDRRRSRSCDAKHRNTETNDHNETKLVGHNSRRSRNSTSDSVDMKVKPIAPKAAMSPGYAQLNKTRQRSVSSTEFKFICIANFRIKIFFRNKNQRNDV